MDHFKLDIYHEKYHNYVYLIFLFPTVSQAKNTN